MLLLGRRPAHETRPEERNRLVALRAHGPADRSWGLYAGLARLAGIPPIVDDPDVTTGSLLGPGGGAVVATNHGPEALTVGVRLPEGAIAPRLVQAGRASDVEIDGGLAGVRLAPRGAAVIAWDSDEAAVTP